MSAEEFLRSLPDVGQRVDARELAVLMGEGLGAAADHVGVLHRRIRIDALHVRVRLARATPRRSASRLARASSCIYGVGTFPEYEHLLELLGPHSTGVGCLYVKRLSDVDQTVLETILSQSWESRTQ